MLYHPIESEMEMFARVYSRDTGIKILFGKQFSTDGKNITIIRVLNNTDPWIKFMIEMGVYHETGHIITKDFTAFRAYFENNGTKKTHKSTIFNCVRDTSIEGQTMEVKWPGMKPKWNKFLTRLTEQKNEAIAAGQLKPFRMLMAGIYFRSRELQHDEKFGPGLILPDAIEEIFQRRIAQFLPDIAEHNTIAESQRLTEAVYDELMKEPPPSPQPEPPQSGDGEEDQDQSDDDQDQCPTRGDGSDEETEAPDEQMGMPNEPEKEENDDEGESVSVPDDSNEDESPNDKDESEDDKGASDSSEDDEGTEDKDKSEDDSEGSESDENEPDESEDEGDDKPDESEDDKDASDSSENEEDKESEDEGEESEGDKDASDSSENEEENKSEDDGDDKPDESEDEGDEDESFSDDAEKELKKTQKEMEDGDAEDNSDVGEEIAENVNKYADSTCLYREEAGLEERIIQCNPRYGWESEVAAYETAGRQMTGYSGTKLKVLFISEKAPVTHRNLKSGKLDLLKLWKLKLGMTEICKQVNPSSRKDSAVSMVVDNSMSMQGVKGQITHSIMTSLSSDLEKMRIPFEAMGFTTQWVESLTAEALAETGIRTLPINIHLMKTFSEPYRTVRHRFVWPASSLATAELPALIFATKRLLKRKETKKVLFLLTDGGTCTGNDKLDVAMHTATIDYIARMKRAGIKVVLIGIMDETVKDYDPEAIILKDLNIFANTFYRYLMSILIGGNIYVVNY